MPKAKNPSPADRPAGMAADAAHALRSSDYWTLTDGKSFVCVDATEADAADCGPVAGSHFGRDPAVYLLLTAFGPLSLGRYADSQECYAACRDYCERCG